MPEPLPKNDDLKKEFMYDANGSPVREYKWKLGKSFATALTGFVAGALAATIMLYPWLRFLGDYCPQVPQSGGQLQRNIQADQGEGTPAPTPVPSPSTEPAPTPAPGTEPAPAPTPSSGLNVNVSTTTAP